MNKVSVVTLLVLIYFIHLSYLIFTNLLHIDFALIRFRKTVLATKPKKQKVVSPWRRGWRRRQRNPKERLTHSKDVSCTVKCEMNCELHFCVVGFFWYFIWNHSTASQMSSSLLCFIQISPPTKESFYHYP